MTYRQALSVCAVAWSAGFVGRIPLTADDTEPVSTSSAVSSASNHQTAWLQLEQGGVDFDSKQTLRFDLRLFLGLCGGKAVVARFVHPALSGERVVWLDAASLRISKTILLGNLDGRTNRHWGDKNVHDFGYTIDAVVGDEEARKLATSAVTERLRRPTNNRRPAANAITGTFTAGFVDDAGERIAFDGKLSGSLVTTEQSAADNPKVFRPFHVTPTTGSTSHQVGAEYQWLPPHTWTTAYANQPIAYPLVDGRLFLRGLDAIDRYDLRSGRGEPTFPP